MTAELPDIVVDPSLEANVIQFVNLDGSLAGQLRMDDPTVTVRIPHAPVTAEEAVAAASRVVQPCGYLVLVRNRGRVAGPWTAGWDEAVLDTFDAAAEELGAARRAGADAMLVQLVPVPSVQKEP